MALLVVSQEDKECSNDRTFSVSSAGWEEALDNLRAFGAALQHHHDNQRVRLGAGSVASNASPDQARSGDGKHLYRKHSEPEPSTGEYGGHRRRTRRPTAEGWVPGKQDFGPSWQAVRRDRERRTGGNHGPRPEVRSSRLSFNAGGRGTAADVGIGSWQELETRAKGDFGRIELQGDGAGSIAEETGPGRRRAGSHCRRPRGPSPSDQERLPARPAAVAFRNPVRTVGRVCRKPLCFGATLAGRGGGAKKQ